MKNLHKIGLPTFRVNTLQVEHSKVVLKPQISRAFI